MLTVCDASLCNATRTNGAWVTRPERPKGLKDIMKQAQRAATTTTTTTTTLYQHYHFTTTTTAIKISCVAILSKG